MSSIMFLVPRSRLETCPRRILAAEHWTPFGVCKCEGPERIINAFVARFWDNEDRAPTVEEARMFLPDVPAEELEYHLGP